MYEVMIEKETDSDHDLSYSYVSLVMSLLSPGISQQGLFQTGRYSP